MSNFQCSTKKVEEKCTSSEKCWIERPKYFKGQLLTDADLRAGLNYVIEKNKLQNRHLHGWGVVCGLKVKCFPCCTGHGSSGKVVVESGYAIDCCGNDIVVCDEVEYDVVKRINELKKKKKAESDPCGPGRVPEAESCPNKEEKYYLTIAYKEEDAKPATALMAKDSCSIQSCVPSRTRECYKLDLVEYCTLDIKEENSFFKEIEKCMEIFSTTWKKVFGEKEKKYPETVEEAKNFIREYHKALPDHIRCSVLDQLDEIQVPGDTDAATVRKNYNNVGPSALQLIELLFFLFLDCVCQAFLNPCPECGKDDVVILATITVKKNKIDLICNLVRKWVMTFPTLFYWIPINKRIKDTVKYLCCDLDLKLSGSLPLWAYMTKLVENDFAIPKTMTKNFQNTLNIIPKSFFKVLDPTNISLEKAIKKESSESKRILKDLKIDVVKTEKYEPSLKDFSFENIITAIPVASPGSKVVQLVDKDNKVVGFRTMREEEAPPEKEEVAKLKEEFAEIKANIAVMKSHMRRDTDSVIETNLRIEKKYQPLTMEITRSLLEEIPVEKLKDVGDVRGAEMRKANINSVRDVLEAVPAKVSNAVKEPMSNAVKYVDNAEDLTLDVASLVAEELKKKKITKKEDLNKLDTKKIATKLKISEAKVKDSIKKIR